VRLAMSSPMNDLPSPLPLALVPLDNRPCTYRFPQQLAAIAGDELLVPAYEILGDLHKPGQADAVCDWVKKLPPVQSLVVSVDMLAYGGLVASRRPLTALQKADKRLEVLREFRKQRPDTPIYAFNILMRLAVTMDSDAAAVNYYNIMRYARLVDEAERFNSEYLREQLENVKNEIPPAALQEYLAARARNHSINLQMIEWLEEGVFDYLLITQEDAAEFGLHRREQDILLEKARDLNVQEKMSLHPGADEAALTLLARHWDTSASFRLHWSNAEDAHRIAPFEDRPFDDSLLQHIDALRGQIITGEEADFEFYINAPVAVGRRDEDEDAQKLRAQKLGAFVNDMERKINAGKWVALCDVAFPNGADDVLMNLLETRGLLGQLAAFAGWNTAGNTLGTVLTQCAALVRHRQLTSHSDLPASNSLFTFERVIDDWFYQARVRPRIEKTARDYGLSPLDLGGTAEPVEAQTLRELRGYAHILAQRHFKSMLQKCEVSLPWHRSFEVDFRATLTPPETVEV
jgi:hypothetical protein